jgi:cytochrome c oxidase cbb3-type subunit III
MPEERDELLSHNYDGIQEYDNDLPRWWLYLFHITIVFALVYYVYFELSAAGKYPVDQLPDQMAQLQAVREANAPKPELSVDSEAGLLAMALKPEAQAKGKEIFTTRCVVCHADKGQGLIGPNLTDDYWIHGGKITDIKRTVVNGVLEKGMLAWQGVLSPDEINQVVAFVWSIHGTNPPAAKAPDGQLEPRQ